MWNQGGQGTTVVLIRYNSNNNSNNRPTHTFQNIFFYDAIMISTGLSRKILLKREDEKECFCTSTSSCYSYFYYCYFYFCFCYYNCYCSFCYCSYCYSYSYCCWRCVLLPSPVRLVTEAIFYSILVLICQYYQN